MDDSNQTDDSQNQNKQPFSINQNSRFSEQGRIQKEQEVGSLNTTVSEELIQPSEPELKLHPEVSEAGIEKISSNFQLSDEHHKVGIRHSGESLPVSTQSSGLVQFSITKKEAIKIAKNNGITDSIKWLAISILRQIKKLGKSY